MSIERILQTIDSLDHVLTLAPDKRSGLPELAWGDYFFYYSPDGMIPDNVRPFATIVTKDYPDDTASALDAEGRWRVNIQVGRERFVELTGREPRDPTDLDLSEADVVLPHPVYGSLGWICVVTPGDTSLPTVLELLSAAHADAKRRSERRSGNAG